MRKKLRVLNPVGHKEIAFGYLSQNGNMKRMDSEGGKGGIWTQSVEKDWVYKLIHTNL